MIKDFENLTEKQRIEYENFLLKLEVKAAEQRAKLAESNKKFLRDLATYGLLGQAVVILAGFILSKTVELMDLDTLECTILGVGLFLVLLYRLLKTFNSTK